MILLGRRAKRAACVAVGVGALAGTAFTVLGSSASAGASPPSSLSPLAPPDPAAPAPPVLPLPDPVDPKCEKSRPHAHGPFYPGPAASPHYDRVFGAGFTLPYLDTHVPQGITTWENWNGSGETVLLVSMYRIGANAYLVAIDPDEGSVVGTVEVAKSHLGGIAIAGGWLFAQDRAVRAPGREPVRRYELSALVAGLEQSRDTGTRPFVAHADGLQVIHGAAFMFAHRGEIWAGHYNRWTSDRMYRYRVDEAGKLINTGASYPVPPRTQGVVVTDDRLIFNTSFDMKHGQMIVTRRTGGLEAAHWRCFATPSMGENMAVIDGKIVVLYEGASHRYPGAVNRIGGVHVAPLHALKAPEGLRGKRNADSVPRSGGRKHTFSGDRGHSGIR